MYKNRMVVIILPKLNTGNQKSVFEYGEKMVYAVVRATVRWIVLVYERDGINQYWVICINL